MANDSVLDPAEIRAALAVLERERAAHLPTPRQNALYRAYNIAIYALAVILLLELFELTMEIMDIPRPAAEHYVLSALFVVLGLATIVLFVLNWGLIRKLYRQARLRRRLKLVYYFRHAFRAERAATRLKNVITIGITVLGTLLVFSGLFAVFLSFLLWIDGGWFQLNGVEFATMLSTSVGWTFVGFGVASLHFMRRGKQRLEVVTRLQETLLKQAAGPAQGVAAATLSSEDYDIVAGMEREHIIKNRATSIISGRKEARSSTYLCQTSRQMNDAKSRLPQSVLSRVDETILKLLTNPTPGNSASDPQTGNRIVPVADTALSILYDINADRHLVRLLDLQGSTT